MIRLEHVYALIGALFAAYAALSATDASNPRRWVNAGFYALFAASFLLGSRLGDLGNGLLAIGLAALAGVGLGRGGGANEASPAERAASAERRGSALFLPALIVPVAALLGSTVLKGVQVGGAPLLEAKQATLVAMALGVVIALAAAAAWLRPAPLEPLQQGRRITDQVGWAGLLPQMLAALGAVFALAGVGQAVADLVGRVIPLDNPFAVVCAYTLGMALFTVVMGNAFAAFPVMTAGVGLPLIVHKFGGDPAVMGAIGMLSGFCGTLVTPMAANFNLVPVALLDLPDRWAVIKVQAPTAGLLLLFNTALMYALVFHGVSR